VSGGSEAVTFRLDNGDAETLRRQAKESGMSPGTLLKQIVCNHIAWQKDAARAGFIPVHKDVLQRLFESLDEPALKKIATKSSEAYVDSLLMMRGKVDLESYLSLLKDRLKASSFTYTEFSGSNYKKIVIQHDMGYQWSIFLKEYETSLIKKTGWAGEIDATANSVIIKCMANPVQIGAPAWSDSTSSSR
jgi:hypothetical protein